jgi:tetratricopeptide (TPR) repeat protein
MPEELAAFARTQGFEARVLVNGNRERLRLLLSNGLPVLVETWLEEEPNDGMGHYRLLTGYDDAAGYWIAYDTYVTRNLRSPAGPYRGIQIPYDEFDRHWQVFNHLYVLVYPVSEAALVAELLGGDGDAATMWQAALAQTEAAVTSQPGNAFAWFNLGTNLVAFGRYEEAASAYDQARRLGLPWRMLWYQFGPFVAYHGVGRHEEVLALADATLRTTTSIEEVHYWRGMALHSLGNHAAAEQAWRRALALNPRYGEALAALGEG